ncbi:hypothetical protein [Burkholderia sp. BCC1977]|uniref:hypothetical protein n=1 Tax=Burkholderia sp. BCC1977 TaxID=2817440 RepID=UPI002ABE6539|nr:hypothetical protein [Burkholderia sp. BCC1977]
MDYKESLLMVVKKWNSDPIEDEWIFEKFREDVVGGMSAPEAFLAIEETVGILLNEQDESTSIEIVQTIIGLALRSQTTELPKSLRDNRGEIRMKFSKFGGYAKDKLDELYKYYRLG